MLTPASAFCRTAENGPCSGRGLIFRPLKMMSLSLVILVLQSPGWVPEPSVQIGQQQKVSSDRF